ncbi:CRISPR system Cascade subunit CasB [Amycolatopsis sulphurea]|uniref:CRISPR system Cascade subunit CasB n=1 Tax=Amycolatopsis sulphurea TaxID=76022 RepID=A0A2A9G2W8_9PSEU|nr:type I-E CRISPR-associated protein Cse2/CasB [Amycolatopsis sulphurea]PFG57150.1 CRISPR system Cascade subunit CasB [Amycolatopsis sulphurea]
MTVPLDERRAAFVKSLYGLQAGLDSRNTALRAACRRTLAGLRRGLTGQPGIGAQDIVFRHDPPEGELDAWLLVAGLFATHPNGVGGRRSLGASMFALREKRKDSATRRFEQLLLRDRGGLPHHLRQVIRLLASDGIAVNYAGLLDDLVILLGDGYRGESAHRVRLRWARDFHTGGRAVSAERPSATVTTERPSEETP